METKHTKGEWFANNCTVTIQGSFREIARCYSDDEQKQATQNYAEMRANAKLIAAAPELLEALIELIKIVKSTSDGNSGFSVYETNEDECNKAINAIKKATE